MTGVVVLGRLQGRVCLGKCRVYGVEAGWLVFPARRRCGACVAGRRGRRVALGHGALAVR